MLRLLSPRSVPGLLEQLPESDAKLLYASAMRRVLGRAALTGVGPSPRSCAVLGLKAVVLLGCVLAWTSVPEQHRIAFALLGGLALSLLTALAFVFQLDHAVRAEAHELLERWPP